MVQRVVFTGPNIDTTERAAMEAAATVADTEPQSILHIGSRLDRRETIRQRWTDIGNPFTLHQTTLDQIAETALERLEFQTDSCYVNRETLSRLIEVGVTELDQQSNLLAVRAEFPTSGHCQAIEDLFTRLEYAGLFTPEAVHSRLTDLGLQEKADPLAELVQNVLTARRQIASEKSFVSERLAEAHTKDTLSEAFPTVDAIIVDHSIDFTPIERNLLSTLIDEWPTFVVLPTICEIDDENHETVPKTALEGLDQGIQRAADVFSDLEFNIEYIEPTVDANSRQVCDVLRSCFQSRSLQTSDSLPNNIETWNPETQSVELRAVAQHIREKLADGTDPNDIGIILPTPQSSLAELSEVLGEYQVPYNLNTSRSLSQTIVGNLITDILALTQKPRRIETVISLCSNPFYTGLRNSDAIDLNELQSIADRLPLPHLDLARQHIGDATDEHVQELLNKIEAVKQDTLAETVAELRDCLDTVAITDPSRLEKTPVSKSKQQQIEQAFACFEDVCQSVEQVGVQTTVGDDRPIEWIERALADESFLVQESQAGAVQIIGISHVGLQTFSHVYVPNLTVADFPSDSDQLAFTESLTESHPDFQEGDTQLEARHQLATLLVACETAVLSYPQRDEEGRPYIPADFLSELLTNTESTPAPIADDGVSIREDIQEAVAHAVAQHSDITHGQIIERLRTGEAFSDEQLTRIENGLACAESRSRPGLTAYDGQLDSEHVETHHPQPVREPYSPTRIEAYAKCGFKYYLEHVLGYEEDEEITLDPDHLEQGILIHAALEAFYRQHREEPGDSVSITAGDKEEVEALLLEATQSGIDEIATYNTGFNDGWLQRVLAGLVDPDTNDYFGPTHITDEATGLLKRFLSKETDLHEDTTARPAWLEAKVGPATNHDGDHFIEEPATVQAPDGREIKIAGKIDRIDVDSEGNAVVRDYKTGSNSSIPSQSDTLEGVRFQLPLYGLLTEHGQSDVEVVGGTYYQVSPPTDVKHTKGVIGSEEYTKHPRANADPEPLFRYRSAGFDNHSEFRRFIEAVTPTRLANLTDALENGYFQPTFLSEDDANCEYCAYNDVCDVRHYNRQARVSTASDEGVYLTERATGDEFELENYPQMEGE